MKLLKKTEKFNQKKQSGCRPTMEYWKTFLKNDPTSWLLDKEDPSIRYWALQDLIRKTKSDPEVLEAQELIMHSPIVKTILKNQNADGYWGNPDKWLYPKYKGTIHQVMLLADLGAKKNDQIEKSIEYLFGFQLYSGIFKLEKPKTERGLQSKIKGGYCYTAIILRSLIHFGYLPDTRTQKILDFFIENHDVEMGSWPCQAYPINTAGVFPENCFMGGVKPLLAFSKIPENERSPTLQKIIDQEIELYLQNYVYKYLRDKEGNRKAKAGWTRFGFPLFYQSDALEVLDMLTGFNVRDERMQPALDLMIKAQQDDGTWLLKNSVANGKMWIDFEEKGKPSKWITLRAMRILKRYYGNKSVD